MTRFERCLLMLAVAVALIAEPGAADIEFTLDISTPGTHNFAIYAVNKKGQRGKPATCSVTIEDPSIPDAPLEFTAVVV